MNWAPSDHEALRRLLALKKYEQPPPGYFDRLPDRIMARLQAGEGARHPWWLQFWGDWELKPALLGALGMALAGVYLLGLSLAGYVDRQAPSAGLRVTEPVYLAQPGLMGMPASAPHHRLSDFVRVEADSSMNPVVNASAPEGLFAIGANLRRSGLERASHSLAR